MSSSDAEKWNARYSGAVPAAANAPVPFLAANVHRLGSGKALVLAAGRGRNAVFLAERGFEVTALDVSDVGLRQCENLAEFRGVEVSTVCADLDDYDLGTEQFDLITMIYYYEAPLFSSIREALRPGGHFLFQTFSARHATVGTFGPKSPNYLAVISDIQSPFADDHIIHLEDIVISDEGGTEAVIQMIARKA